MFCMRMSVLSCVGDLIFMQHDTHTNVVGSSCLNKISLVRNLVCQTVRKLKISARLQNRDFFCCYIFVSLFGVKILNIILCMSRCGVYACVRRWAICVRPRRVWLSMGIDVCLWRASKMYMMVSVSIPRRCMRIDIVDRKASCRERVWYWV